MCLYDVVHGVYVNNGGVAHDGWVCILPVDKRRTVVFTASQHHTYATWYLECVTHQQHFSSITKGLRDNAQEVTGVGEGTHASMGGGSLCVPNDKVCCCARVPNDA